MKQIRVSDCTFKIDVADDKAYRIIIDCVKSYNNTLKLMSQINIHDFAQFQRF